MSVFRNVSLIKEKISLLALLKNLGFKAQKVSKSEYFFLSMLREEYTASLCVNDELGIWFDQGGAGVSGIKGGTIIDFGLAYWYPSELSEVLIKIIEYSNIQSMRSEVKLSSGVRRRMPGKVQTYEIAEVRELGTNDAITSTLRRRGVAEVSGGNLYELYYYNVDDKNQRKKFFAPAWPNENGGWEIRNKNFNGSIGNKGMSFLAFSSYKLCVFEDYYDFLSWQVEHLEDDASILVLNSFSFLQAAKARSRKFRTVELYFKNDKTGSLAARDFVLDVPNSCDCSSIYSGFKGYNQKILAELNPVK